MQWIMEGACEKLVSDKQHKCVTGVTDLMAFLEDLDSYSMIVQVQIVGI